LSPFGKRTKGKVLAWGIAFNGVDPTAGGAIIGTLIGGEAVLKWITKAGRLGIR